MQVVALIVLFVIACALLPTLLWVAGIVAEWVGSFMSFIFGCITGLLALWCLICWATGGSAPARLLGSSFVASLAWGVIWLLGIALSETGVVLAEVVYDI